MFFVATCVDGNERPRAYYNSGKNKQYHATKEPRTIILVSNPFVPVAVRALQLHISLDRRGPMRLMEA